MKTEKDIITYKGFDCVDGKLSCRDHVYEEGKVYVHNGDISMCRAGFHSCRQPADVLEFYSGHSYARCRIPKGSQIVESGKKICSNQIMIEHIMDLKSLINEIIKQGISGDGSPTTGNYSPTSGDDFPTTGSYSPTTGNHSPTTGNCSPTIGCCSPTTGDYSPTSGDGSLTIGDDSPTSGNHSPTSGDDSPTTGGYSPTTGDDSPTSGDSSPTTGDDSPTTGDNSPTTGSYSPTTGYHSPTTGYCSPTTGGYSPTTGYCSPTTGYHSPTYASRYFAGSFGGSAVGGELGVWLTLCEWGNGEIIKMEAIKVDGKKIKPGQFYQMINKKIVPVPVPEEIESMLNNETQNEN